jgi:membrane protein DedA with SNARE-associated domain
VLQALNHPDAVLALGAWAYVVLAFAVLADSVVPLIPSEVLCVAAGAFAAGGRLNVWLVLPAVVIGGVLGDQATYHLGRVGTRRAVRTMTATPRRQRFFERLQATLSRRRTSTIVVARFVPGGRTGVGLLAGMTDQPRRGYAAASLLGVSAWALFLVGAGFVAGHAVDSVWMSIGIALALTVVVSAVAAVRTRRDRRSDRTAVTPTASSAPAPAPGWRQPVRARGG